jgi:exosome complex exonuclease RRP6
LTPRRPRSFQGFTCLIQISTRSEDWLVDALALRSRIGPALAPLLADPTVVKVLHGADHDVTWLQVGWAAWGGRMHVRLHARLHAPLLWIPMTPSYCTPPTPRPPHPSHKPQRDFGLYIINLFDTGQAARVLGYPSASLAHLLARTAAFAADKRFQLADWRARPLSDDMRRYARCDTHYLLHAHDCLKAELRAADRAGARVPSTYAVALPRHAMPSAAAADQQQQQPVAGPLLATVLERSRLICAKTYEKEPLTPASAADALERWRVYGLSPVQTAVFSALYAWRDAAARALDESTGYVLPRGQLCDLARAMPRTAVEARRALGPHGAPVALARAGELAEAAVRARQQVEAAAAAAAQQQQAASAAQVGGAAAVPEASAAAAPAGPALVAKVVAPLPMRRSGGGMLGKRMGVAAASALPAPLPAAAVAAAGPPAAAASAAPDLTAVSKPRPSGMAALMSSRGRQPQISAPSLPQQQQPSQQQQQQQQQQQGKLEQLRASFALPFIAPGAAGPLEGQQQAAAGDAGAVAAAEAAEAADAAEDADEDMPLRKTTAEEVRAVADAMRAEAAVEEADRKLAAERGRGGGEEEDEEAADADEEDHDADFIPLSDMPSFSKKGGKDYKRRRLDGVAQQQRAAAAEAAAARAKAEERRDRKLFDDLGLGSGSGGSESGDSDREEIAGAARAIAEAQGSGRLGGGAAEGDGEDEQQPDEAGRGARGRGHGRERGGGAGRRGGRGRGGARGAALAAAAASLAAVRSGRGDGTVVNPFAIPDENLIKGGKRSANAPRSGNRSATFR